MNGNQPAATNAAQEPAANAADEPKTPRNDFGITSNAITAGIAIVYSSIMIAGGMIALLGISISWWYMFWGVIIFIFGGILFATGHTELPAENQMMLALTWWGKVIRAGEAKESIAVKGMVFLCNVPLVWLSGIRIEGTWHELKFPMKVLTSDNIPMDGDVVMMARANRYELHHFLNNGADDAGRWDYIVKEMTGIVVSVTRLIIKDKESDFVMNNSVKLSEEMEAKLLIQQRDRRKLDNVLFQRKTFGIEVVRVRPNFSLPDDVMKSYTGKRARTIEYEADCKAAEDLIKKVYETSGEKLPFREALDRINTLRRVREGKDRRIDIGTSSGVTTVNVYGMGSDSGK